MGNSIPPHKAMVIGIHDGLEPWLKIPGSIQMDTRGASTFGTEKNARKKENVHTTRKEDRRVRSSRSAFSIW